MSKFGDRDGTFFVKKLRMEEKITVIDTIPDSRELGIRSILTLKDMNAKGTAAYQAGSLVAQPDFPRNIIVHASAAGTADGTSDTVLITGYDGRGNYIEEEVRIAATAAGTAHSDNCFARIGTLTPKTETASGAVKSTAVTIGLGDHIGLSYKIESAADLLTFAVGSVAASTFPTVDADYHKLTGVNVGKDGKYTIRYRSKLQ